ncbi:hypothetical protein [Streptomyces sp. NPDC050538]|uniref:hypothetical protein n=1 Tax=Streptomyces sp. NPDC050538 TaxID=3365627 RepID=UPI0037B45831
MAGSRGRCRGVPGVADDSRHNGLYIGDGKLIHAPRTGKNIEIAQLSSMPFYAASRP